MVWLLVWACSSPEKIESGDLCLDTGVESDVLTDDTALDDDDSGGSTEDSVEETDWSEAVLRILSPQPNDLLPLGEGVEFKAAVLNSESESLAFDDIVWSTDVDPSWTHSGTAFTDDALPAGNHVLSVNANLPNGDRLGYAIGGVLVQHPDAGVYAGTMSVNVLVTSWDGTEIPVNCAGSATITVAMDGLTATGSSACLLNLFEQQLETNTLFEIDNAEGQLTGLAIADLVLVGWDFDLTGTLGGGELQAAWSDNVFGVGQIDGSMNLVRVSLY